MNMILGHGPDTLLLTECAKRLDLPCEAVQGPVAFAAFRDWLLAHPECSRVWMIDNASVGVFGDPFADMLPGVVTCVREWGTIRDYPHGWLHGLTQLPDDYARFTEVYGDHRALLPTAFGGDRDIVLAALDALLAERKRCLEYRVKIDITRHIFQRVMLSGKFPVAAWGAQAEHPGLELIHLQSPATMDRTQSLARLRLFSSAAPPFLRPDSEDRKVWEAIYELNEYKLPKDMKGQVVIDVGMNIGSFAAACLDRGAELVIGVEPDRSNYESALKNTARFGSRIIPLNQACWLPNATGLRVDGSGPHCVVRPGGDIPTVTLDRLIEMAGSHDRKHVDLLKLDAEGAEYPAIYHSKNLDRVNRVVGEYHEGQMAELSRIIPPAGGGEYTTEGMLARLQAAGMRTVLDRVTSDVGFFTAER